MYVSDGHVYMACLYNYVCIVSDDTVYLITMYAIDTCILCMPYLCIHLYIYVVPVSLYMIVYLLAGQAISLHDCMYTMYTCILCILVYYVYLYTMYTCILAMYVYLYTGYIIMYTCILYNYVYLYVLILVCIYTCEDMYVWNKQCTYYND